MKIKANNISINYELAGSGKCLTLIHGAGDNLNGWFNQVPVFSQHYQVLTYDVRGHGQTELPEGELTTELWVDDLYALLKALDIGETFLLGHSMGGRIAQRFTLTHPEMVKALILSNSTGAGPKGEEIRQTIETVKKEGMEGMLKDRFNRMFSPGFVEKNPEIIERHRAILLQNNPEGYLRVMQPIMQPSERPSPSTRPDLSKITCPTLIIVGEYDSFSNPAAGKATQEAIPGSQLKVFPTGHAPAWEQPEAYNKTVLDFLSGVT